MDKLIDLACNSLQMALSLRIKVGMRNTSGIYARKSFGHLNYCKKNKSTIFSLTLGYKNCGKISSAQNRD